MSQGGRRSLPDGWRWVRLGEAIREAKPGFACGVRDPHGVIQVRMNNVDTRGRLVWEEFLRVPADEQILTAFCLVAGDVLFNNTNSVELVGKSAYFDGYPEPVVYSNHFTRLRTKSAELDPTWLCYWLVSQWNARVFERVCNRWVGQSAVKNDKLLALDIPLPRLAEQKRIASLLNEGMAEAARVESAARAEREAIAALPAALLRRAFEGGI